MNTKLIFKTLGILSLVILLSCNSKTNESTNEELSISGDISGATSENSISAYIIDSNGDYKIETVELNDKGKFTLNYPVKGITEVIIFENEKKGNRASFIAEGSNNIFTADIKTLKNYKLKNSSNSKSDYIKYNQYISKNSDLGFDYVRKQYAEDHPKSEVTSYIVWSQYRRKSAEEIRTVLKSLDPSLSNSKFAVFLSNNASKKEKVGVGQKAPDFTLNNTEGVPTPLSSIKGKAVLIDFWASWCGPCRRENPNLVKIYKKYHNKGLEILSVSLDDKKENWLKAIKDDQLTWHHVSDLKKWNNMAAQLYVVQEIPHTVLLDENGVIVAKKIYGEELEKKIDKLLK